MSIENLDPARLVSEVPFSPEQTPAIWVVGSGMTVAVDGARGVPGTGDLAVALMHNLRTQLVGRPDKLSVLQTIEEGQASGLYSGFELYQKVTGLYYDDSAADDLSTTQLMYGIRKSVLCSINQGADQYATDQPIELEDRVWREPSAWSVRPGLSALAQYVKMYPRARDHAVFTTNFDPLISVAFLQSAVSHARAAFEYEDYALSRVAANVPVIYHVHGYWTGQNTLNLSSDLLRDSRGQLAHSISMEMIDRTIVVVGYGGWDDVLMGALKGALASANTKVLWLARDDARAAREAFSNSPGRVKIVRCHDVDSLLSDLVKMWARSNFVDAQARFHAERDAELLRLREKLLHRTTHAAALADLREAVGRIDERCSLLPRISDGVNDVRVRVASIEGRSVGDGAAMRSLESLSANLGSVVNVAASHADTASKFRNHRRVQYALLVLIFVVSIITLAMFLMPHFVVEAEEAARRGQGDST